MHRRPLSPVTAILLLTASPLATAAPPATAPATAPTVLLWIEEAPARTATQARYPMLVVLSDGTLFAGSDPWPRLRTGQLKPHELDHLKQSLDLLLPTTIRGPLDARSTIILAQTSQGLKTIDLPGVFFGDLGTPFDLQFELFNHLFLYLSRRADTRYLPKSVSIEVIPTENPNAPANPWPFSELSLPDLAQQPAPTTLSDPFIIESLHLYIQSGLPYRPRTGPSYQVRWWPILPHPKPSQPE